MIFFFQNGDLLKTFQPLHDRVLVERFAAEVKTKGGIMLPEKSQGKVRLFILKKMFLASL